MHMCVSCFNPSLSIANSQHNPSGISTKNLKSPVGKKSLNFKASKADAAFEAAVDVTSGVGMLAGGVYRFTENVLINPPKTACLLDFFVDGSKMMVDVLLVGPLLGGIAANLGLFSLVGVGLLGHSAVKHGLKALKR